MNAAERRRQKLLARAAQLEARGGGSNPNTTAQAKPVEQPVTAQSTPTPTPTASTAQTTPSQKSDATSASPVKTPSSPSP